MKKISKTLSFLLSFALILSVFPAIVSGLDLGVYGDNLTWTVEGDTLTISGTGEMRIYESTGMAPWNLYSDSVKHLVITEGVESISSYAFGNMYGLETVSIAESVKSIGYSSFISCGGIKSIKLPSAVTVIPSRAFMYCTALKNVEMGDSVVSIEDNAFHFCENMVSIAIPASTVNIADTAFEGCSALYTIFGEAGSAAEEFAKQKGIKFMTPLCADELASATPADLGDDFFATIHISALNKRITNNGQNNVVASQITTGNDQRWHFVKEDSTNAYSISSKLDEQYIAISDTDASLSNVYLSGEKHLFNVYEIRGGYVIAPAGIKDRVVDVNGYDMNVQFYTFGGYNALQIYEFLDVFAPIPPENVMNTGDPVDLGDDFVANINVSYFDKTFTNNGAGNVFVDTANGSDAQKWHFVKVDSTNAYTISSLLDGCYMGVADPDAPLSNVHISATEQKFHLYLINDKYVIAPVGYGENVLDINAVDFNVQYYIFAEGKTYQQYDIVKLESEAEPSRTPADLGDDFAANINIPALDKTFTNNGMGNVFADLVNNTDAQKWHFVKVDSSNAYTISSVLDGKYVGVSNLDAALANVHVSDVKQEFYVYEMNDKYVIVPVGINDKAVDVNGVDFNVQYYQLNEESVFQKFDIIKLDENDSSDEPSSEEPSSEEPSSEEPSSEEPSSEEPSSEEPSSEEPSSEEESSEKPSSEEESSEEPSSEEPSSEEESSEEPSSEEPSSEEESSEEPSSEEPSSEEESSEEPSSEEPSSEEESSEEPSSEEESSEEPSSEEPSSEEESSEELSSEEPSSEEESSEEPSSEEPSSEEESSEEPSVEDPSNCPPSPDDEVYMDEETATMPNVKEQTTVSDMLSAIEYYGYTATVTDKNGNVLNDADKVGTGCIVKVSNGKEYTVIVKGDVDGSGTITSVDYLHIKSTFVGGDSFTGVYFAAADIDGNASLNTVDYLRLKSNLMGIS